MIQIGNGPRRVLVVDDDPEVLEFIDVLLGVEGFSTLRAHGGEEALDYLSGGGIDLVLLDIAMPGVDGLELCRRIKGDAQTSGIPVVVLSARPGEVAASEAQEAGADDFLRKPFDNDELLGVVRSKLGR